MLSFALSTREVMGVRRTRKRSQSVLPSKRSEKSRIEQEEEKGMEGTVPRHHITNEPRIQSDSLLDKQPSMLTSVRRRH